MTLLSFVVWCAASYLIGCVSWSYLIVRWKKGIDLRTVGSGNLGATNAGRVLGMKWAVAIYFLDFTKGLAAAGGAGLLWTDSAWNGVPVGVPAGLLVMVGHIFPVHLGFKGGKGVATGSGVMLALSPLTFGVALAAWVISVATTRMVSLGSVLAAVSLPISYAFIGEGDGHRWRLGFFTAAAVLVAIMHRSNIGRILRGEERRIGRSS